MSARPRTPIVHPLRVLARHRPAVGPYLGTAVRACRRSLARLAGEPERRENRRARARIRTGDASVGAKRGTSAGTGVIGRTETTPRTGTNHRTPTPAPEQSRAHARDPTGTGTDSTNDGSAIGGTDTALRVLLVGPVQATGGIARYIDELRARLPEGIGVGVYDTAAPEGSGPVWFARGVFGALADVLSFPFCDRPDVVHVHTAERYSFLRKSAYVLLTRYVRRRPAILHVHGPTFDRFLADASLPLRVLQRAVFGACAAIVVLSPYWERVLGPYLPGEKVVVLPNAIDTSEYEPRFGDEYSDESTAESEGEDRAENESGDGVEGGHERPHVVFVGNHVPRKGIREFVAAIDEVLAGGTNLRVTIAGSGPLDRHASELADRYSEVSYLGYVSEERKRELLCEASIYALPAYAEGLPIGVLEGMAGGNAIVATDVGGVGDLVDEQGGRLVPPRDTRALVAALGGLCDASAEVEGMGRHNATRVEAYTWERVVPQLTDLYERVAARGPPRRQR